MLLIAKKCLSLSGTKEYVSRISRESASCVTAEKSNHATRLSREKIRNDSFISIITMCEGFGVQNVKPTYHLGFRREREITINYSVTETCNECCEIVYKDKKS